MGTTDETHKQILAQLQNMKEKTQSQFVSVLRKHESVDTTHLQNKADPIIMRNATQLKEFSTGHNLERHDDALDLTYDRTAPRKH